MTTLTQQLIDTLYTKYQIQFQWNPKILTLDAIKEAVQTWLTQKIDENKDSISKQIILKWLLEDI